jgi:O-antigen biosynthesis protein
MKTGRWDAIIVNFNGSLFLDPCLRALARMQLPPERIIVVDNASTDDSLNELAGWPQVEVIESPVNLGYAGGANRGVNASDAPIFAVLNPDVELDAGFGTQLCSVFEKDESLGIAGAKLRYPDSGLIQHAGGQVHLPVLTTSHRGEYQPNNGQYDTAMDVDYVTGAAISIRRATFEQVGGFDSSFHPAYWEDVDLCWRVRAGGEWTVRYVPSLSGVHHEGAGEKRGNAYFITWTRNRLRFALRHLTAEQWWREFVPAEIDRLRGELSAAESPDWLIQSGGASIEQLARTGGVDPVDLDPVSRGDRLVDSVESIRELAGRADPRPGPLTPSDGVVTRLKRFLSRFSGRLYAEDLYWQQRQFNESVVRAFEAQDRLNREMVVQLLLTMLLIGGRPEPARSGKDSPGRNGNAHPDAPSR